MEKNSPEYDIDKMTNDIKNSSDYSNRREPAFVRFENRVITYMMKKLELFNYIPAIKKQYHELTGKSVLNFRTFYDNFKTFPTWVVARKVPYAHKIKVSDLVNPTFRKNTNLFSAFSSCESLVPGWVSDRTYALVFEWLNSGAASGYWVMHNDSSAKKATIYLPELDVGIQYFSTFVEKLNWNRS